LDIYARYDLFCPDLLPERAEALSLDRAAFEAHLADPALRQALVASKQEGLRNKVEATPTLFIDGRRYVYENKVEVILDVIEEAVGAAAARPKTIAKPTP
jgi:protein-disulfide isomerase